MLEKAVSNGTGKKQNSQIGKLLGKTGTTQDARDAWFIGFTSEYIAGVWMGYDNNKPLNGVTGGGLPTEIWSLIMIKFTPYQRQPLQRTKENSPFLQISSTLITNHK